MQSPASRLKDRQLSGRCNILSVVVGAFVYTAATPGSWPTDKYMVFAQDYICETRDEAMNKFHEDFGLQYDSDN
jgi:hypothetical protein